MGKTAVVTGVTGQDGAYLAEFLLDDYEIRTTSTLGVPLYEFRSRTDRESLTVLRAGGWVPMRVGTVRPFLGLHEVLGRELRHARRFARAARRAHLRRGHHGPRRTGRHGLGLPSGVGLTSRR